jgi:modulator of FtsH protease
VTAGWENFFVAQAGASAALSGLLFVAVSINLTRILQYPHLPGRAAETLVVLLSPLGVATIGLVPGLDLRSLGIGLLLVWFVAWVVPTRLQLMDRKREDPERRFVFRILTGQLPTLPIGLAGLSLLLGFRGGLYFLVAGVFLAFSAGVVNAWVLLIEILR